MNAGEITLLLKAHGRGDDDALQQLVPLVYADLRRLARAQLRRHRPGDTLDTTALVNEAYVKLVEHGFATWQDRGHFFAVAATAMRQILVDYARRWQRRKRGGGAERTSVDEQKLGLAQNVERLLQIDLALEKLAREDLRLVRTFECRYFAGYSEQEAATALGVSLRTVQRDWLKARAWLRRELGATVEGLPPPTATGGVPHPPG